MKVLIPLDGSRLAENAVHYVGMLALIQGIEARLVSVLDPSASTEINVSAAHWEQVQERRTPVLSDYLEEQAGKLAGLGIPTTITIRRGPAAKEIQAEAASADLLVISSHGSSGFERWRRGSVADKLVRAGVIDTLVVGPHAEDVKAGDTIHNVMVPLDGSQLAEQALPVALDVCRNLGARLHFVEAVPFPAVAEGSMAYMFDPKLYQDILDAAESYLEGLRITAAGLAVQTAVIEGSAANLLSNYIAEKAIDLVIMTSHGRGGLLRTALGSVTDRLIGGRAPVLVVHARAGEGEGGIPPQR